MTWLIIVLEITHMVHSEGKSARLVAKGGRRYPTLLPTLTDTLCSASGMNPILNSPAYIVIARVILLAKKYSVPLDNYRTPPPISRVPPQKPLNSEPLISVFTTKVCILRPRPNKSPSSLQNMSQTNDVKTNKKQ